MARIDDIPGYNYEEKAVAFIDILGFKEHVKRSQADLAHMRKLLTVLHELQAKTNGQVMEENGFHGMKFTHFSDSLVVSFSCKDMYLLILHLVWTQLDLAHAGFFVRGGVTVGQVYHEGNIVVGPAMIEAYELESKVAKYPRIILHESYIEKALEPQNRHHQTAEEEWEYFDKLLKRDIDGFYYIDFFQAQELDDPEYIRVHIGHIEHEVNRILSSNPSPDVYSKMHWMRNQLIQAKNKYGIE
jgi:hypothetical protein